MLKKILALCVSSLFFTNIVCSNSKIKQYEMIFQITNKLYDKSLDDDNETLNNVLGTQEGQTYQNVKNNCKDEIDRKCNYNKVKKWYGNISASHGPDKAVSDTYYKRALNKYYNCKEETTCDNFTEDLETALKEIQTTPEYAEYALTQKNIAFYMVLIVSLKAILYYEKDEKYLSYIVTSRQEPYDYQASSTDLNKSENVFKDKKDAGKVLRAIVDKVEQSDEWANLDETEIEEELNNLIEEIRSLQ